MFVKNQVQEVNGTDYEYYYIYYSYYVSDAEYPNNFMVGKVDDSVDSLVDQLRNKAEDKGLEVSQEDLNVFRKKLTAINELAEDQNISDDDLGEFFKSKFKELKSEDVEDSSKGKVKDLISDIKNRRSDKVRNKLKSFVTH